MKEQLYVLLVHYDLLKSTEKECDYDCNGVDLSFLNKKYDVVLKYLTMENYKTVIDSINKDSIILNLCDGMDSEGVPGECVVSYLHDQKRLYTGSSPINYQWKKSDIKKYNVSTPKYLLFDRTNDINKLQEEDFKHMKYPFILKPDYNGGSSGITNKSCVYNFRDTIEQLNLTLKEYPSVLIEEFIIGREFTVLVSENYENKYEPLVLEPLECVFTGKENFKHYDLKWYDWETILYKQVVNKELENKIMNFSKNLFVNMKIDGYVRFDLRMDVNDTLYVNDVNPYCGLYFPPESYGSADLILKNSKITNHYEFTEHLINCAKSRFNQS